jgi:hypothetical protein
MLWQKAKMTNMSNSTLRAAVLLVGSVILLMAFYMQPSLTFTALIGLHGLAVSIPSSLGFMLNELEVDSFTGILSMLGVLGFGVAMAGIFASIMLSAGVVFVVVSIVLIIGISYTQ